VVETQLAATDQGEKQKLKQVKVKATIPDIKPKKDVLPLVQPMDASQSTETERRVSNWLWNDIKAYNAFDGKSPVLLPATERVEAVFEKNSSDIKRITSYEEAERAAREAGAGVSVWGNAMEYEGNVYIESHLSLVDEPTEFQLTFQDLDQLNVLWSISRTRFVFALTELSKQSLKKHRLVVLEDTKLHVNHSAASKSVQSLKAGLVLQSDDAYKDWFKVKDEHGWVHASRVSVIPKQVYLDGEDIAVLNSPAGQVQSKVARRDKPVDVKTVALENGKTWFELDSPRLQGWVSADFVKAKPLFPMTEFMISLQFYQAQQFEDAIAALNRFVLTVDPQEANNVSLSTAYQMLTLCYMQIGQWQQAVDAVNSAVKLTQYDPAIHNLKVLALVGYKFAVDEAVNVDDIAASLEYSLYLEPENKVAINIVNALKNTMKQHNVAGTRQIVKNDRQNSLERLTFQYSYAGID
jgi:tetratricopeptide (TPR) repeat protein